MLKPLMNQRYGNYLEFRHSRENGNLNALKRFYLAFLHCIKMPGQAEHNESRSLIPTLFVEVGVSRWLKIFALFTSLRLKNLLYDPQLRKLQ
jgi:hypothetical protein